MRTVLGYLAFAAVFPILPELVGQSGPTFSPMLVFAQSQAGSPRSSPDEVVLDGAKNPELFPEWFIWEHSFHSLAGSTSNRRFPLHLELGISEAELKILLNEVRVFRQLQSELGKQLDETRNAATAQRKSEDQIRDATHVVNLQYRHKVLEARQRVYERFSPESLIHLREWINQLIQGTEVRLRGRAIKFFKEPW